MFTVDISVVPIAGITYTYSAFKRAFNSLCLNIISSSSGAYQMSGRKIWRDQRLAALKEAPVRSKYAEWEYASKEHWCDLLSIRGSFQLIAFLHESAVGIVGGLPTDEAGTVELGSMWVAPAARVQELGT